MRFADVPVVDAVGGVLAHSLNTGGLRLRKGRMLTADDIQALQGQGVGMVVVALLEPTDVPENDAARRVAEALVGPDPAQVELTTAFTGRVNVIAKSLGVARVDVDGINALNAGDAMITCATAAPFAKVRPGDLIATIKIISYAVSEASVVQAEGAASHALGMHATQLRSAHLIVTQTGAEPDKDKGVAAVQARLTSLGVRLASVTTVPHQTEDIAGALSAAEEDLTLILTASATSDPLDVGPAAVRQAGGVVTRFGMPVDPGNLLFIGEREGRPVIGLPGCARSPALNGADWVLERVVCGVAVTSADIAGMGVGGLLKEIPQRPQPRRG